LHIAKLPIHHSGSNKAAIVIPVYKDILNNWEVVSFKRCIEVFKDYTIILVAPSGLNLSNYYKYKSDLSEVRFSSHFFKSISSYNKLMMTSEFYKQFLNFEYILIYQLDAFVFENSLDKWCSLGYDYIGAPWVDGEWIQKLKRKIKLPVDRWINKVGNGGLSLRKVSSFYKAAKLLKVISYFWKYNEDFFWGTVVYKTIPSFKVPDWKMALNFAFEDNPSKAYELNGKLPFACHAWEKYDIDFWKPFFEKYGYKI
jgi:hypothetical protein